VRRSKKVREGEILGDLEIYLPPFVTEYYEQQKEENIRYVLTPKKEETNEMTLTLQDEPEQTLRC
jgi:hypothetical protein